ncbi:hypothetical protein BO71DRAFT_410213 [Aspergillus ellipticus CBS 707.79]|uniref:VWFA domain-containing protein n=1 Tax=Aspergillus ellipticus CBS 707.79 TaxID=1448320 RepID=A0A319DPZ7_9EURO|nr:hypothetical protein BO71DRAFT_410213 [Aspergillus ellipticus CBS 707.79]
MDPYFGDGEQLLDDIVSQIVEQFFSEFNLQLRDLSPDEWDSTSAPEDTVPETEDDWREYVWRFIERNLSSIYPLGNPSVEELVHNAANRAMAIAEKYHLRPDVTPKVVLMGLYDFVILCDDSTSMNKGTRIQALEDTCHRIAEIAGLIQPHGVHLRFLNYSRDRDWPKLSDHEDIKKKVEGVKYSGKTRLGTVLRSKIAEPLIVNKAKFKELERPIITIVITDGCPDGEDDACFAQTVLQCKQELNGLNFDSASAVFIISRVGNDPKAEIFLHGLRTDTKLEEALYCCMDQLDGRHKAFDRANEDIEYSSFLIDLFAAALDSQTDME